MLNVIFITLENIHNLIQSGDKQSKTVYFKIRVVFLCVHTWIHEHTCLGMALERNAHSIAQNGNLSGWLIDNFYFLLFLYFLKFL